MQPDPSVRDLIYADDAPDRRLIARWRETLTDNHTLNDSARVLVHGYVAAMELNIVMRGVIRTMAEHLERYGVDVWGMGAPPQPAPQRPTLRLVDDGGDGSGDRG